MAAMPASRAASGRCTSRVTASSIVAVPAPFACSANRCRRNGKRCQRATANQTRLSFIQKFRHGSSAPIKDRAQC